MIYYSSSSNQVTITGKFVPLQFLITNQIITATLKLLWRCFNGSINNSLSVNNSSVTTPPAPQNNIPAQYATIPNTPQHPRDKERVMERARECTGRGRGRGVCVWAGGGGRGADRRVPGERRSRSSSRNTLRKRNAKKEGSKGV